MFDPLTRETQKVLALSKWEAERYRSHAIETEHILLAMAEESLPFAKTLAALKMDQRSLRKAVEGLLDPESVPWRGRSPKTFPLSKRSRKVLGTALRCAQILRHRGIAPEHLLIALAHVPDGIAYRTLEQASPRLDTVRTAALRSLASQGDGAVTKSVEAEVDRMRKALREGLAGSGG
jgi:ATP-dependent Clp protease ATP-binding subunit ClpC